MRKLKALLCCAGVLLVTVGFIRAEYPSIEVLLGRFHNIPSAYKELIVQQRAVEEEAKAKSFGEESKEPRPKFCFEETTKGEKFVRSAKDIDFQLHCIDPKVNAYDLLYDLFYGTIRKPAEKRFLKDVPIDEEVRKAVWRSASVVASEAFFRKFLGDDGFEALLHAYNAEKGEPRLRFMCEFRSVVYEEARENFLKHGGEWWKFRLPETQLPECMDRMTVDINVTQIHYENFNAQIGAFVKIAPKDPIVLGKTKIIRDFNLHLRLTVNMRTEEVEDVKICDEFIVNRLEKKFSEEGRSVFEL